MSRPLAALLAALGALAAWAVVPPDPPDLYIAPYLQNVRPDGVTIMWETAAPVAGWVRYGPGGRMAKRAVEAAPAKIHEIRLDGLEPGTGYAYQVGWGATKLQPLSFTTSPPPGTKQWRMVVYGDNRSNPDLHTKIVRGILELNPGIVLNSGDLVAQGSVYEQWKPQYFDPLRPLAGRIPIFPCLGNHEQNSEHYYRYHSLPPENDEVYYSFDYANAHIVALNSNARDAPFDLDSKQTRWLIEDLRKNRDATWKIVFFHHPLFRSHPTRGVEAQRWVWQRLFEELGVDLVVNGHDHYYMRSYAIGDYTGKPKRGVFHLISGGGGAPSYPIAPKIHAAHRRSVHHFTAIDIDDDRLAGRAIDIDGKVFDAFVVDRQAVQSPEEFIAYEMYEFERDLAKAIRESPVAQPEGGRIRAGGVLEIQHNLRVPLEAKLSWRAAEGWRVEPARERIVFEPGRPFRLDWEAEGSSAEPYPAPTALLEFRRLDGELAFRNDRLEFHPVRFAPLGRLTVGRAAAPEIDGRLIEPDWRGAKAAAELVDMQGAERPRRDAKARFLHDGERLYVAVRAEAARRADAPAASAGAPVALAEALRGEYVRVALADGARVLSYVVARGGDRADADGANDGWTSGFSAAAGETPDGWLAELSIPLDGLRRDSLRVNVFVRDAVTGRIAELAPTYGHSGLDHFTPDYRSDPLAAETFVPLALE